MSEEPIQLQWLQKVDDDNKVSGKPVLQWRSRFGVYGQVTAYWSEWKDVPTAVEYATGAVTKAPDK